MVYEGMYRTICDITCANINHVDAWFCNTETHASAVNIFMPLGNESAFDEFIVAFAPTPKRSLLECHE